MLISNSARIVKEGAEHFELTRPLLSLLQAESMQLEELLDAYGAKSNQNWYRFRMHIAMLKNMSCAGYELLHLRHTCHTYDFEGTLKNFERDTDGALQYVTSFLFCALKHLLNDTQSFNWPPPEEMLGYDFSEKLPEGRLPKDRSFAGRESAQQLVIQLATSFLNSTEDAKFLDTAAKSSAPKWRGLNLELLSEASIRRLQGRFHNLQSLYDTYVSYSNIEDKDTSLRRLRGHISLVLHLLTVTTIFMHFYERHIELQGDELFCRKNCVLKGHWFLELLTHYLCHYSYEFLSSARGLCQQMLRKYAVVDTIEVPAPRYFGFHVRPSTLISTIVRHYGSDVSMILDKEYDASIPMNLFLANEWINQLKRTHVTDELVKLDDVLAQAQRQVDEGEKTRIEAVHYLIRQMAKRDMIHVLVYPVNVEAVVKSSTAPSLLELMQTVIANLHAQRCININYTINVRFRGDIRILNDIRILAENGYGENERGANVALPAELSYLNHFRPGL
ncbi:MAG: hypothetical protein J6S21_04145 [Victivallales bacterium]|nr:hypothetical protein [Victivallales bacterium]